MTALYETDFSAWTYEQAEHLKKREFTMLDYDHLIEEIETLSGSTKSSLKEYLKHLLSHLLKIKYQPSHHGISWDLTIKACKQEVFDILDENPSLKSYLPIVFPKSYRLARFEAVKDTKLDLQTFPDECPWMIEEVLFREEEK